MWRPKSRLGRWALAVLGGFFVALGAIGAFVPGLPTTIFLIVACFAFARSCPAMETWLRSRAWTQPFLPFLDGQRLPKRLASRVLLIILASAVLAITLLTSPWTRVLVGVFAALGMLSVILRSEWISSGAPVGSTARVEEASQEELPAILAAGGAAAATRHGHSPSVRIPQTPV